MIYTKKPTKVEAFQFNPDGVPHYEWDGKYKGVASTSYLEVHKLLGTSGCSKEYPYWTWDRMGTVVTAHGQTTIVVPGDYVVTEPDGIHHYPVKKEIFEAGFQEGSIGSISDGYHTFDELYEFRKMYNAALFNEWANQKGEGTFWLKTGFGSTLRNYDNKHNVHKSWRHHDGELCFGGGWFIVSAMLPTGQISNHYKAEDWDLFKVPEVEKALFEFDGHTAADVLERLKSL